MVKVQFNPMSLSPKEVLLLYERRNQIKKSVSKLLNVNGDSSLDGDIESLRTKVNNLTAKLTSKNYNSVIRAVDKRYGIDLTREIKCRNYQDAKNFNKYKSIKKEMELIRKQVKDIRNRKRQLVVLTRVIQLGSGHNVTLKYHGKPDVPVPNSVLRLSDVKKIIATSKFTTAKGGLVHTEPNQIKSIMALKDIALVTQPKIPPKDCKKNYIGIEFEMITKLGKEDFKVELAKAGLARYVCLGEDGSVRNETSHPHAHELRVLVSEDELDAVLDKLKVVFAIVGGKTNKSCGMHVHLDMRNRDHKVAFNNLVLAQGVLYEMVHAERKKNQYCRMTQTQDYDDFHASGMGKYSGINANTYRDKKTLEVRIHHGCCNTDIARGWVKLLINIVSKPEALKEATETFGDFVKTFNLTKEQAQYIKDRVMKFRSKDKVEEGEY